MTTNEIRRRHLHGRRSLGILVPSVIALLSGLVAMVVTNTLIYSPGQTTYSWVDSVDGAWGRLYGSVTVVLVFGLVVAFTARTRKGVTIGLRTAASVTGLFGAATIWWIIVWRLSPFTLEGAWIYPLAIVSISLSLFLGREPRRLRSGRRAMKSDHCAKPPA